MTKESLIKKLRQSIIGTENQVPLDNGAMVTGINFDNAATTPPFYAVLEEIQAFAGWYSSVQRGTSYKSMVSSDLYEAGRQKIKDFVGADPQTDILIYTKSTTEAINILAHAFHHHYPDAVILSTQMEHLANDLPWRAKFVVDYVQIDNLGRLKLSDLEDRLKMYQGKVKLVTVSGASNVTGIVNPLNAIAELAHRYNAELLVDGAQLVPHDSLAMQEQGQKVIDYLVFSAHKMYAPLGIGILIGPKYLFKCGVPPLTGGGAIKLATAKAVYWNEPPYRYEAGSPNVIGIAALLKAIEVLQSFRLKRIHRYEQELMEYILNGLRAVKGIYLYGDAQEITEKVSIISFTVGQLPHRCIAKILADEYGIAVRSGLFCAHPYVQNLLQLTPKTIEYYRQHEEIPFPGLVRISLGLYNQYEEADRLIKAIYNIADNQATYRSQYAAFMSKQFTLPSERHQLL